MYVFVSTYFFLNQNNTNDTKIIGKNNFTEIINEFSKYNWQEILNSSFQEDYAKFHDILNNTLECHTPDRPEKNKNKNL